MKTAEEIIVEIIELPLEEQQKIAAFMISADFFNRMREIEAFPIEEDSDAGLEEDLAELDRNLQTYKVEDCVSHEELCRKYGIV
ncbi:MAG: hypothetical protein AB1656_17580 [Candidatus Omnitrophota bacterium]